MNQFSPEDVENANVNQYYQKALSTPNTVKQGVYDDPYAKVNTNRKPSNFFTEAERKAIDKIVINDRNFTPYGSYSFVTPQYASDIDLMERVEVHGSRKKAIKVLAKNLKKIVRQVVRSPGYYYSELKCGLDTAYLVDMGKWANGVLVGYDASQAKAEFKKLYQAGLLDKSEYLSGTRKLVPEIKFDPWDDVKNILRKHYILRWTAPEVEAGVKKLPGHRRITLEEAIDHVTMIKLDMITDLNGRYVEITNFYILEQINSKGQHILINLPQDFFDEKVFTDSILHDAEDILYDPSANYLKFVKRIWTVARSRNDQDMLKKLTPVVNSEAGLLGQIKSDVDTMILMIERLKHPPMEKILMEINNLKTRLAKVNVAPIFFKKNNIISTEGIKRFFDRIDRLTLKHTISTGSVLAFLKELKSDLSELINGVAGYEMMQEDLWTEHNYEKWKDADNQLSMLNLPREYFPRQPKGALIQHGKYYGINGDM